MSQNNIFNLNRVLGYVSNGVSAKLRYVRRRNDYLIITCIGKLFQVYTASHFRLLHVSQIHPEEITCIEVNKTYTFVGCNKLIYAWRYGKHIEHIYKGHTEDIKFLLPFKYHLIAIDSDNILKIWDIESEDLYAEIPFSKDNFHISAIAHPITYLNKILLGSEQGTLQLWNIKKSELVYAFKSYESKITAIESSPAVDVAAIGLQNGCIILLHLKYGTTVMKFEQLCGPVTKISFRSDGVHIMATSSTNGTVVFWDLCKKRIISQLEAHGDSITTLMYLPNEPLLLTTSPDNSVKLWIFDLPDNGARLLRLREGHTTPPLCIRYYGLNGESILSSSEDSSLRKFSAASGLIKSMGKATYYKKGSKKRKSHALMPPITYFSTRLTREKEWDNIAALHKGIAKVTTWSFHKSKLGEHRLLPEELRSKKSVKNVEATSLIITHCGNFVIIGYSSGDVERFNIQSGIHRGTYGNPAHKYSVEGISCDNLNQFIVTGDSEGNIKFWKFKENLLNPFAVKKLIHGITMFETHEENALIAIGLSNFSICVLDSEIRRIIRIFKGHTAKINDIAFSPDCKWVITASMDSTIKVWDISSACMINHFKVDRPCISLTMSPTGDFLGTIHVSDFGIHLWANRTLLNYISLRAIDPYSEAPNLQCVSINKENNIPKISYVKEEEINAKFISSDQLSIELITLFDSSAFTWQNLLDLDIINKHNKAKLKQKIPKQVPFFLQTTNLNKNFLFDFSEIQNENSKTEKSKKFYNDTKFSQMLKEDDNDETYKKCVNYIKEKSSSIVDFEIKSFQSDSPEHVDVMLRFLKMIIFMYNSHTNYELCESIFALFLKVHGEALMKNQIFYDPLSRIEKLKAGSWKKLEKKFLYGICVVNDLRNYVSNY